MKNFEIYFLEDILQKCDYLPHLLKPFRHCGMRTEMQFILKWKEHHFHINILPLHKDIKKFTLGDDRSICDFGIPIIPDFLGYITIENSQLTIEIPERFSILYKENQSLNFEKQKREKLLLFSFGDEMLESTAPTPNKIYEIFKKKEIKISDDLEIKNEGRIWFVYDKEKDETFLLERHKKKFTVYKKVYEFDLTYNFENIDLFLEDISTPESKYSISISSLGLCGDRHVVLFRIENFYCVFGASIKKNVYIKLQKPLKFSLQENKHDGCCLHIDHFDSNSRKPNEYSFFFRYQGKDYEINHQQVLCI